MLVKQETWFIEIQTIKNVFAIRTKLDWQILLLKDYLSHNLVLQGEFFTTNPRKVDINKCIIPQEEAPRLLLRTNYSHHYDKPWVSNSFQLGWQSKAL